jgi:predicted SAM-dependent methyltransferase
LSSFCGHKQILREIAPPSLYLLERFDWVYSSHLLEDFSYTELIGIINEWRRILVPGE